MICKKHGDVGDPLSDGSCIKCTREKLGEEGISLLEVLVDMTENGKKWVSKDKAMKEALLRVANSKIGST